MLSPSVLLNWKKDIEIRQYIFIFKQELPRKSHTSFYGKAFGSGHHRITLEEPTGGTALWRQGALYLQAELPFLDK